LTLLHGRGGLFIEVSLLCVYSENHGHASEEIINRNYDGREGHFLGLFTASSGYEA